MNIKDLFLSNKESESSLTRPYIIAEAGVNHEGSIDIAKRLIREAKDSGADAIKFQTYKAESLASKNSPSYWDLNKEPTTSQFTLFKKYDSFEEEDFKELKKYCNYVEIEFLSTPFDMNSAQYLNEMQNAIKISSSDITNKPFIEFLCSFKKPIILSTGASTLDEITDAKRWIEFNNIPIALLHCVLNYPTEKDHAHLGRIIGLKRAFPATIIGYSDHTIPNDMKVLEIASLLGAKIIEKHFTHDKTLPGNDHYHAMDKEDLKGFLSNLKKIYQIIGDFGTSYDPKEEPARKNARRSLIAKCHIPRGTKITSEFITWKRPGTGICPKDLELLFNKISIREIDEDEILSFDMFR
jgi:sialic acid synthase SpsE